MKIDSKAIKELAKLLDETGLNEIEVAEGDQCIRVGKGGGVVVAGNGNGVADLSMPSDPALPQKANVDAPDTIAHTHPGAITSPMVGTVYLAEEPDAPPFVQKGDNVKSGDTLIIIEAMKVINPIKAEKAGIVIQISVEDGQPVEFGDVLMVIE